MSPIFAIGLILCVLFCGLTVDVGRMELIKIQMQSASDAAAVGAELEAERVGPGTTGVFDWVTHGQQDAAINGFTDGKNGATVSVIQDPTSGPYIGRYDAIQVTITQTVKSIFMGALHGGSWTMRTESVALVPPCSYFLGGKDGTYSNSFLNASAVLFATCPVYANYNFMVDGFSKGWGFGLDVSGTIGNSGGGGWTAQQTESGYGGVPPSVAPNFGVPVITDPLLNVVTQPTFSACDYTSKTIASGALTLIPGIYCGTATTVGLKITNATVTLKPGLYVITGGASISSSTVTGTGVTLFLTKGNGSTYGQFVVGPAPSTINLSAPVDASNGGIPEILFFADRSWVATSAADFIFDTYSSFNGDGIWYLPNTGLYIWQNTWNVPNYGSFVTRNTYFFGTTITQNGNFSWLSGGSPFRTQSVLVQ